MVFKAVIIDNEVPGSSNLQELVSRHCRSISVVALANNVPAAGQAIISHKPDIIFIDIESTGNSLFSLLNDIYKKETVYQPYVVFITSSSELAIKATRYHAFDYILRPIEVHHLLECERKLGAKAGNRQPQGEFSPDYNNERLVINHSKGVRLICLKDIQYLEADNNYTVIHLCSDKPHEKVMVSKTLGDFEPLTDTQFFFRVHKSFIINIAYMREYISDENGYVVMHDDTRIDVSRRKSIPFRQFLKSIILPMSAGMR